MTRPARLLIAAALVTAALCATSARASVRWSQEDYERAVDPLLAEPAPSPLAGAPPYLTSDYAAEYRHTADFLRGLQVTDPLDPEFGGEQEGEHLRLIVQSDNTQETIWVWSRLHQEYGVDSLLYRVANAWTYIGNFPAYNEEGSSSPDSGYYRVYNCAWGLRAEMMYRAATGDTSKRAYADSCASYLRLHPLKINITPPTSMYARLNGLVQAWACGNLYEYGQDVGNPLFTSAAAGIADSIRTWIEADSTRLRNQVWAMSGGAAFWGVMHSYFAANPSGRLAWANRFGPLLGYYAPGGQYANAWNGWFTLGQWAAWEATGSATYLNNHRALTDSLLAKDGDGDGGIPVRYIDFDTQDQSWVSNYMAYMGLDQRHRFETAVPGGPVAAMASLSTSPSPTAGMTRIRFGMSRRGDAELVVHDALGRVVARRVSRDLGPGAHEEAWEARDASGHPLAPGVYYVRLLLPDRIASGKLVIAR